MRDLNPAPSPLPPLVQTAVYDPGQWNDLLVGLPAHHVLQSWEWGEIKRQSGWRAQRLVFARAGQPVAAAQVLTRRLGPLPLGVQYIPKGPALDYADRELVTQVLAALERQARQQRMVLLKLDPDVPADTDAGRAFAGLLKRRGWTYSADQVQFKNTALLDLTPPEEAILAAFKPKWRYNLRLSERKGVHVRTATLDDLDTFYRLYQETAQRDSFIIRPYDYYRTAWETFLTAQGQTGGRLFLADVAGDTVAGLFLARFHQTVWFLYGASSDRQRETMPNHRLQWEAMRWAKSVGCTSYDLWGAPTELVESDPLWGVWRFKEGFGARLAPHVGAYDFAGVQPVYWLYTVAMPKVLEQMRRSYLRRTQP